MAGFDPDAYLATPAPAPAAFDPDAYLASKPAQAEKPGVLARIGAGIAGLGAGALEMVGLGAPVEVAEMVAGRKPTAQHFPAPGPYGATPEQAESVERQTREMGQAVQKAGGVLPAIGQAAMAPIRTLAQATREAPQTLGQAYDVGKAVPQAIGVVEGGKSLATGIGRGAQAVGRGVQETARMAAAALPKPNVAPIVRTARQSGYVIKPSEAGQTVGAAAEGVTGSPRLSIEATVKNQKNTNALVNQELGLPKDTKLTPKVIRQLKDPQNAVYDQVGRLGQVATDNQYATDLSNIGRTPGTSFTKVKNPDIEALRDQYLEKAFDSKDAILQIRKLRKDAGKNIKNPDPTKNEMGYAQRQVADALENQIERHAQSIGQTDLVDRFRAARKELAKIHSVEDSLNIPTGDISASKLSKMRAKGAPLSGNLLTIADVHDAFPSEMRDVAKVRNKIPVTVLEGAAGVLGGVAAKTAVSPAMGIATAAGVAARPGVRKLLLSDVYQDVMTGVKPSKGSKIGGKQTLQSIRKPLGRAAAIGAGVAASEEQQ